MIAASRGFADTARVIAITQAMARTGKVPVRLNEWRLHTLDRLLNEVETCRVNGDRIVPTDLGRAIQAYARSQDPQLATDLAAHPSLRIEHVHDALFGAQGRVMYELARQRHTVDWRILREEMSDDWELDDADQLAAA